MRTNVNSFINSEIFKKMADGKECILCNGRDIVCLGRFNPGQNSVQFKALGDKCFEYALCRDCGYQSDDELNEHVENKILQMIRTFS